ncbi:MAG: sigma 54-interacting transcriptional regulator [Kofleriaceae bacterium]
MAVDRATMLQTGLANQAARPRAAARRYVLQVLPSGASVAVGARPAVVGAHGACDLVIDDAQASRRHAEVSLTEGGVRIRDLGSTNGTWWNGSRLTEAIVPGGSTVTFGSTAVRITVADAPAVPPSEHERFGGLVGGSFAMRELFAILELAAPSDATVLIEGESGTGKELVARALHDASARAAGPFVVVDCSAIGEALLDSHLFGHVRGAFTGAERDRKGAFVEASGGTLFLDELGELPLPAQARLLRALEAQTVQPVGADRPVSVDTRVVAATHRDLAGMVAAKAFRFDLFYRLAVVHVALPPLRARLDDLPLLVRTFAEAKGRPLGPVDGDNLSKLTRHAWPGNVRELRNVLERAWAMSPPGTEFRGLRLWVEGTAGAGEEFVDVVETSLPFKDAKERWNDHFERRYLTALFAEHAGNVSRTAAAAGLSRRHLRELLVKHGLVARAEPDADSDGADEP